MCLTLNMFKEQKVETQPKTVVMDQSNENDEDEYGPIC